MTEHLIIPIISNVDLVLTKEQAKIIYNKHINMTNFYNREISHYEELKKHSFLQATKDIFQTAEGHGGIARIVRHPITFNTFVKFSIVDIQTRRDLSFQNHFIIMYNHNDVIHTKNYQFYL